MIFSKYIDIYIVAKSAWVTEQDNSQDINAAHWGGGGYIPVIEIQFNSIKREIYKIFIFQSEKFIETKTDFLRRFIIGNVDIFSPSK